MKTKNKCKHVLDWNECGYGGGPTADAYCIKCKQFVDVPLKIYRDKVPYLYYLWLINNGMDPNSDISK